MIKWNEMNRCSCWCYILLCFGILLAVGFYADAQHEKMYLQEGGNIGNQAVNLYYAPVSYYFSDIAADAPGRLDKITFHPEGTYDEMIDFIDKTNATSSAVGTWKISGSNLLLTPATTDSQSYTFSLASSTNESLIAGMEEFDTQSFTKQSCEKVTNNVWDDWLQGCWQESKAQALLKAYSSSTQ